MLAAAAAVWFFALLLALYANAKRPASHRVAVRTAGDYLKPMLLRLPLAMLAAGFIGRLLPEDLVARTLGGASGPAGILLASVLGGILPGGPFVAFPLVATLYQVGAGKPQMVALLTAWSVYAMHRVLAFEWPMLGLRFVLFRLAVSCSLPPVAGLLVVLADAQ